MKLQYTSRFTLTTAEVEIKTGNTPGNGTIPNNFRIGDIQIYPDLVGGAFPVYWVCGVAEGSEWIKVETGAWTLDGLLNNSSMRIKADSGSITMNMAIKGD